MTAVNNLSKIFPFPAHPMQRVLFFLTLIFSLMSCSPIYLARTEEDFQSIPDLEKLTSEEKDASLGAKYHLQLGWLYSNYKNPQKDYQRALKEFDAYLSAVPEGIQTDEIQNWLSVLRALERSERRNLETRSTLEDQAKKNQQLRGNIEKLLERNASLEEANAGLNKALEGLKNLNLQVEKKRKSAE
jgi:hypothetical protein